MINPKIWNINIDIKTSNYRTDIKTKQGDIESNIFKFKMVQDALPYSLVGLSVNVYFTRPDRYVSFIEGNITDAINGEVEVTLTNQVLNVPGIASCELLVIGTNGEALSTIELKFEILKSINYAALESQSEFNALVEAISELTEIRSEFDAVLANATEDSEVINARNGAATLKERLDTEKASTLAQLAETDQRIDNIVTTPVPVGEVIAQEIIGARQGELSLPANITKIKSQLAENTNSLSLHRVNADIHKPIFIRDRLPVSGFNIGDMVFVFENILSWEPSKWEKGSIASANGSLTVSETRIRTIDFIPVNPSTSYLVYDATPTTIVPTTITIVEYDASDVFVKTSGWINDGTVITMANNTAKVKIVMQNSDSSAAVSVDDPQNISKPVMTRIY